MFETRFTSFRKKWASGQSGWTRCPSKISSSPRWVEFTAMRSDLNLSTRPFPAYRLVNLALILVFVVLLVVSVWQAYGFIEFSAMARAIRDGERNLRAEAQSLEKHVASLETTLDRPEASAKLNEIGFLNGLI